MSDEPKSTVAALMGSTSITLITNKAEVELMYAPTQRRVAAGDEYALARAWAELVGNYGEHEAASLFRERVQHAGVISMEAPLLCFRGRRENAAPGNMGPPPADKASAGRYNATGEPTLYLAETERGVVLERPGIETLWMQRFRIPDTLRVADFTGLPKADLVNAVFYHAELAGNPGQAIQDGFSRYVGQIVREQFDGMRVPGVRGTNGYRYSNVVVFRVESWREWLDGDRYVAPINCD
jgi:hypothetical protein